MLRFDVFVPSSSAQGPFEWHPDGILTRWDSQISHLIKILELGRRKLTQNSLTRVFQKLTRTRALEFLPTLICFDTQNFQNLTSLKKYWVFLQICPTVFGPEISKKYCCEKIIYLVLFFTWIWSPQNTQILFGMKNQSKFTYLSSRMSTSNFQNWIWMKKQSLWMCFLYMFQGLQKL